MDFRKYNYMPISTSPLLEGIIPSAKTLEPRLFIVVAPAPDNHVLTEAEWSEIVGDNILFMGEERKPKSKYKISELRIFHSPFSEEAESIMGEGV